MKTPIIKKSKWYLIITLFIFTMLVSILLLYPYEKQYESTVEPIHFSGAYQLEDGIPPQPLTGKTNIDACTNKSVTLRGTFSRELKKDTQILFFMEYLEVHIYLNDEEIYAWGTQEDHPAFLDSAGAAWGHFILPAAVLPEDEVRISLTSKYANNYNRAYHNFLDSLQIGDSGALAREILGKIGLNC